MLLTITLIHFLYYVVSGQGIQRNPAFQVTEDLVFDRLAYPSIPERSIEVQIPLNVTPLLDGLARHYHLAGALQNTCDQVWKQTVDHIQVNREKRSGRQQNNIENWGPITCKPIHMDYRGTTIKQLRGLCERFYKDSILPEPYAYHLMEQLMKHMKEQNIGYTIIHIHSNQNGKLVFPRTNASTTDLDRATVFEAFSQMRDQRYAVTIVDSEGKIMLAPTENGKIPDLNTPIEVLCEKRPLWKQTLQRSRYRDNTELILVPGKFHPLQAQDRCTYMGFYLPYADNAQDRQRIMKFAKANQVSLVHIFSRQQRELTYSLGRQTEIVLNEVQYADFVHNNEKFVYNINLAAIGAWTPSQIPEALMCYHDLKLNGPPVSIRRPADQPMVDRPNQIATAGSIPEKHLNDLATVINNCYHTMDDIETCGVREISNILQRVRSQSVNVRSTDKPMILVYPLYQTPQNQETIKRQKRNLLAIFQEIYQIPIVRKLVNKIPTLIEKGVGWISSLIHPRIKQEKRTSYAEVTKLSQCERQHETVELPMRTPSITSSSNQHRQSHHYELTPQQLHAVNTHEEVQSLQQKLNDIENQVHFTFQEL